MQRIEAFLVEEEVLSWATCLKPDSGESAHHVSTSGQIGFEKATFQWNSPKAANDDRPQFMLRNLDVFFPIGQLTIVAGPTGSGKTALLNALLGGEFRKKCLITCSNDNHTQSLTAFPERCTLTKLTTELRMRARIRG